MTRRNEKHIFTAEEDRIICTLLGNGVSLDNVAARIGIGRTLITARAVAIGCYSRNPQKMAWSVEDDMKLRRMIAVGSSYAAIGEAMGRSDASVRRRAAHLGCRSNAVKPKAVKIIPFPMIFRPRKDEQPIEGPTLVDLSSDQCRWPIGVNEWDEHVFCGCPKAGQSYCAEHVRVAGRRA